MTTPTDPHGADPWGNGGDPALGAHAAPSPLIGPDGAPMPPVTADDPSAKRVVVEPPPAPLHERVRLAEDSITNVGTGVLVSGGLAVVGLIVTLIFGGLYLSQRSELGDLQARVTAGEAERARVDGIQQDATCTTVQALRSTQSVAVRDAWPGGHGAYDAFFGNLTKSATELNCSAG